MALFRNLPRLSPYGRRFLASKTSTAYEKEIASLNDDDSSKSLETAETKNNAPSSHATSYDPFESVPLRNLATYLGETFSPKLETIKKAEKARNKPKTHTEVMEPPEIPHFLPLTRWAAQSEKVRETLIVDETKKCSPRLSWYHPDDTMVPRDWFSKGLLADIAYYRPFGKKIE